MAVLAVALVWWATGPWGPGLSPDAIAYSAVAESLLDGHGLGYWLEPSLSTWPPGFPALLAVVARVGDLSVAEAGRLVNAVAVAATVVVAAVMARRCLANIWLRWIAVGFAALSAPLVVAAVRVWSEPVFNLLVLGFLIVLARTLDSRANVTRLLCLVAIAALAVSVRYVGMTLLPVGCIVLLLRWPAGRALRDRLRSAALFGLSLAAALAVFAIWNHRRTGRVFGDRWSADGSLLSHLVRALEVMGGWVLPLTPWGPALLVAGIGVVTLAVYALVRVQAGPVEVTRRAGVSMVAALAVFVLAYFAYLVVARTVTGFDPVNSRLLLPIFLPSVLVSLWVLDGYTARLDQARARRVSLALPLLVLLPTAMSALEELRLLHDAGHEYANEAMAPFSQDLAAGLDAVDPACPLVSNDPWVVWVGGVEAQGAPERHRWGSDDPTDDLSRFATQVQTEPVCVIWVTSASTLFHSPDELREAVDLDEVASRGLVTVYVATPRT